MSIFFTAAIVLAFLQCASCSPFHAAMSGNHLRMVFSQNPPYDVIRKQENGTMTFDGTAVKISDWWSRRLNITFSFIVASDELVKRRGINAAIELLIQGEADVTGTGFAITPDRVPITDYLTFPSWQESFRLVVPRPGEQSRLFAIVRPFDNYVWILFGVSLPITVLVMSCLSWVHTSKIFHPKEPTAKSVRESRGTFSEFFSSYSLYTVNIFTNHGDYLKMTNHLSFTIFVSFWLLGISVLVYGYTCVVVSSLTVPKLNPAINSFDDLLKSKEVAPLLRTDLYWGNRILNSESGVLKQLSLIAKRNPESLTNDPVELDKRLITGRFAFPFSETFSRFFIATQFKKDGKCRFQESDPLSQATANSFYYNICSKNSPFRRTLTLTAMEMWQSGVWRKWKKDMEPPRLEVCLAKSDKATAQLKEKSIKLIDLASAFLILGLGTFVSLVAFLSEIFLGSSCKNQRPKKCIV